MPGAIANGRLAQRPIAAHINPATRQVLVTTAGKVTSWPPIWAPLVMITALTTMMYDITMNVVSPARTSVLTLVPRADRWNIRPSAESGTAGAYATGAFREFVRSRSPERGALPPLRRPPPARDLRFS